MSDARSTRDDSSSRQLSPEALLEVLSSGVLVLDADWRLTFLNGIAEQLMGGSREELLGQVLWELKPHLQGSPLEAGLRRAMAEGVTVTVEELHIPCDAWYELRMVPREGHLVVLFQDVTARRKTEEARERSASRLARLQEMTAKLSTAASAEEVVDVIVRGAMAAVEANGATVILPEADGRGLRMVRCEGVPEEVARHFTYHTLDADLPITHAFRSGVPEWLGSPEELAARHPHLLETLLASPSRAVAVLPMHAHGTPLGAMTLAFPEPRTFSEEDRGFMMALAHQGALALDRARLFDREQAARAEAEAQRARLYALVMQAPAAMCLLRGPEHVFELSNSLHRQLHGGRDFSGLPIRQAQPELEGLGFFELLEQVYATGEPFIAREYPVKVALRGDGVVEERFFDFTYQPLRDSSGQVDGVVSFAFEVTAPVRARHELEALASRLREGEERFRRIFDSPMVGMVFSQYSGRILEANEAFLRMLGFSREDLAEGRVRWDALTPPEHQAANARAVAELRASGFVRPFEKEFFREDGSRVPVLMGSTRIEEQELNVTFALDLTERKRAEERLRFLSEASTLLGGSLDYATTLESLARLAVPSLADWCAVDILTEDGKVERLTVVHPHAEPMERVRELNRRKPIVLSAQSGAGKVMRTGEPTWVPDVSEETLRANVSDLETLVLLRELGLCSYLCVPLVARGRVLGALTLAQAESGRHYTEEDLRLVEELGRRASLSVDNARLYRDAQEAIRVRDEFLSIASHELKTPLTSLRLQLSLLGRRMGDDTLERLRPKLEVTHRQVDRLASLVDTLLDVSRIATGRIGLELAEMDLALMVRESVERLREVFEQAGSAVSLRAEEPVVGCWDALRVEQVIVNLLTNAAKYGRGRPISITVEGNEEWALFRVQDEGIGVAAEDLPRLFGRFERAVSGRHYGGLGLGLYISREIVEALGGKVSVDSRLDEGSTFIVELPRSGPRRC